MNLSAYDKISGSPTKSKIYMSNNYPYIVTREVKKRKYYCFVKRYDPNTEDTVLYLVLLDDNPGDRAVAKVHMDDYGRLKFNMSQARDIINLEEFKPGYIKLILESQADDGDIYRIELL